MNIMRKFDHPKFDMVLKSLMKHVTDSVVLEGFLDGGRMLNDVQRRTN